MATYVVSDLHGYNSVFERGLEEIGFSSGDTLYVIGDAIDRGPEGISILSTIMQNDNMELLIGNHEFMMLNSVDSDGDGSCNGPDSMNWLYGNGGKFTFDQYCMLLIRERKDLLEWLRNCYLIRVIDINGKPVCLTHSYYSKACEGRQYRDLTYNEVFKIVWTSMYRDDSYSHGENIYKDYDYLFVTGHVPVHKVMRWYEGDITYNRLDIFRKSNFIDIDGGLAMGESLQVNNGALFLRLDDMKIFPIPLSAEPHTPLWGYEPVVHSL